MKHLYIILLIPAAFASGLVSAQTVDEADLYVPRYDVEIVIFKNNQVPKSKEYILPVSSPLKDKKILDLSSRSSIAAARKLNYNLIQRDKLRLFKIVENIVNSPRYELLLHTAWRQPGLELGQVLPVWIRGGRIYGKEFTSIDNQIDFLEANSVLRVDESVEYNEETLQAMELQILEQANKQGGLYELEGKITVALSRYLHTYADLVLRRPRQSEDSLPSSSALERYPAEYLADTRILNNHSLKEHRRMRSKNLHYLDNPEFAMVILITPYDIEVNFVEEAIDEETDTTVSE